MKVLHIGGVCTHGGAESFAANLIREQRKLGIEADIAFWEDWGAASQFVDTCRVLFLNTDQLTLLLLRESYDVLHGAAQATAWAAPAIRMSGFRGAIVTTSHAIGDSGQAFPNDAVIAVSKAVATSIGETDPAKLHIIYNGVNTTQFHPPAATSDGPPILAWIGRSNDPLKDRDLLLAVANSDIARQFQLAVVDGSPEGADCASLLPQGVICYRQKPWHEMPDFYRTVAASGGVLLSTSVMEACPMTILEAMACGCPAIAPAVGGIPEIVEHQVTGYLYDRNRGVEAIREGLAWLYTGERHAAVVQAASDHVTKHRSAELMCRDYLDIYERALRKHPDRARTTIGHVGRRVAIPPFLLLRRGGRKAADLGAALVNRRLRRNRPVAGKQNK